MFWSTELATGVIFLYMIELDKPFGLVMVNDDVKKSDERTQKEERWTERKGVNVKNIS